MIKKVLADWDKLKLVLWRKGGTNLAHHSPQSSHTKTAAKNGVALPPPQRYEGTTEYVTNNFNPSYENQTQKVVSHTTDQAVTNYFSDGQPVSHKDDSQKVISHAEKVVSRTTDETVTNNFSDDEVVSHADRPAVTNDFLGDMKLSKLDATNVPDSDKYTKYHIKRRKRTVKQPHKSKQKTIQEGHEDYYYHVMCYDAKEDEWIYYGPISKLAKYEPERLEEYYKKD